MPEDIVQHLYDLFRSSPKLGLVIAKSNYDYSNMHILELFWNRFKVRDHFFKNDIVDDLKINSTMKIRHISFYTKPWMICTTNNISNSPAFVDQYDAFNYLISIL